MYARLHVLVIFLVILSLGCTGLTKTEIHREQDEVNKAIDRIGIPVGKSFSTNSTGDRVVNRIELNYQGTDISDASLAELSNLRGVVGICLSDTRVTDESLSALSSLPDLEYVQLANTWIPDVGLVEFKMFPSLKRLDLRRTEISKNAGDELSKCNSLLEVYSVGTELRESFGKVSVNAINELNPYFRRKKPSGDRPASASSVDQ